MDVIRTVPPPDTTGLPDRPPEPLCNLPVFRPVTARLLALLGSEDVDAGKVTGLLNSDPAFSAEILTVANSPLYAQHSRIVSVQRAVMILGIERTRSLAVSVALRGMVRGIKSKGAGQDCWRHSRATAVAAEFLAPFFRIQADQAYTAGLMHDIGRLGMLSAYPEYPSLLTRVEGSDQDLIQAERSIFTVDHCQAGSWLTRLWKLPEEFWDTASLHHEPVRGEAGDRIDLVRLSCLMAQALAFKAAPRLQCPPIEDLIDRLPPGLPKSRFSAAALEARLQQEMEADSSLG